MHQYRFKVFPKRSGELLLQLYNAQDQLIAERPLTDIESFITAVEDNYRIDKLNLNQLGQQLFHWLDGPTERWLAKAYQQHPELTLHIDVDGRLRHLPWELLHDGNRFLCVHAQFPLSPIRRVNDYHRMVEPANRPLRVLFMATSPQNVQPILDYEREEAQILKATRHKSIDLVVEESGSLEGLATQIDAFEPGFFDVYGS